MATLEQFGSLSFLPRIRLGVSCSLNITPFVLDQTRSARSLNNHMNKKAVEFMFDLAMCANNVK
jgi:hypothetical protein